MRWLVLGILLPLAGCLDPADNTWARHATQLDDLDAGRQGTGIRVALLDTGIDLRHPSLAHLHDGQANNGELVGYVDFLGSSQGPHDDGGHGTFIAGVLAARAPQGLASVTASKSAVEGLAPGVSLLVGRVCTVGDCSVLALWKAIEWAVAEGADIISLSLGFANPLLAEQPVATAGIQTALAAAEADGILVVAAAGNTDGGPVLFPAREATVLAVGAMDRDGKTRDTTARGFGSAKPDLVAPGQNIIGPDRGDGLVRYHGTSAAVPFVVAAAALIMADAGNPHNATEVQALRDALTETASPLLGQRVPHDPWAGHGLVQAAAARHWYASAPGHAPGP